MKKFIKVLSIINVLLLSLSLCSCSSSDGAEYKEKYNSFKALNHDDKVAKMKEEVEFMCDKLEKKHKNLYHSISKEEFKLEEANLIEKLPEIENETEYYFALSELITSLKDAHTRVRNNDLMFNYGKFYAFNINKFDDSWILTGIGESNKDKLGYEVKYINNIDIKEVYNRALNFYPHENPYVFTNNFSVYVKSAELLKEIEVLDSIDADHISLTLTDSTGNEVNLKVSAAENEELSKLSSLSENAKATNTAYLEDKNYWNSKLSNDVYYIQYNQCEEDDSLKMDKFTSEVSNDIKNNNFKKIIIDLRYNGGGDSKVVQPLYDELSKLKSDYKFDVYILIGNRTFSSALLNAYEGKKQLKATLVGQPTGGNLNHYGEVKTFELPYSGYTITYCVKYFENVKGYDKDALYPDIDSAITLDDYLNGVDSVVQAVINDEE